MFQVRVTTAAGSQESESPRNIRLETFDVAQNVFTGLAVIESEVEIMAKEGPSEEEINKAKTFLKGSFALGLDTSNKIASQLVTMQLDNLGIDYIERRASLIDAVTPANAKRVAQRLLGPGLLVTVVGRPQGAGTKGSGG